MVFVEQFPLRIQIIFGGNPNKAHRSLKSASLVTMKYPLCRGNTRSAAQSLESPNRSLDPFQAEIRVAIVGTDQQIEKPTAVANCGQRAASFRGYKKVLFPISGIS